MWLASVALANWFNEDKNRHYLDNTVKSVVELVTGTGLLGISLSLLAKHASFILTDLEKQSLDIA